MPARYGSDGDRKPRTQEEVEEDVTNVPTHRPAHEPFNMLHIDPHVHRRAGCSQQDSAQREWT